MAGNPYQKGTPQHKAWRDKRAYEARMRASGVDVNKMQRNPDGTLKIDYDAAARKYTKPVAQIRRSRQNRSTPQQQARPPATSAPQYRAPRVDAPPQGFAGNYHAPSDADLSRHNRVTLKNGQQAIRVKKGSALYDQYVHLYDDQADPGYNPPSSFLMYVGGQQQAAPAPAPPPREEHSGVGGHGGRGGGGGGGGGPFPDPYIRDVHRENPETSESEVVEERVTSLLEQDNPYMRRARTRGRQAAAARGLLNTSIAEEAVEAARVDAALPIASQDASTFFSQAINNQNTINRFRLEEADQNLRRELAAMELDSRFELLSMEMQDRLRGQALSEISAIYRTPGLTPAQQENAVSRVRDLYGMTGRWAGNFASL